MNTLCPEKIDCPGSDFPIENYSAEAPDLPYACLVKVITVNPPLLGVPGSGGTCEGTCKIDASGELITSLPNSPQVSLKVLSIESSMPVFQVGTVFNFQIVASGGPAGVVYAFTISEGVLPDGLSMSSSGLITGSPTVNDVYSFKVRVSAASCLPASRSYSGKVIGAPGTEYAAPSAYYKMGEADGNAVDSVAGHNMVNDNLTVTELADCATYHGSCTDPGVALTTDGKFSNGYKMTKWAARTSTPTLMFTAGNPYSFRFWFRPHSDIQGVASGVFLNVDGVELSTTNWNFSDPPGQALVVAMRFIRYGLNSIGERDAGTSGSFECSIPIPGVAYDLSAGKNVYQNLWHYVAVSCDSIFRFGYCRGFTINLNVDGVKQTATTVDPPLPAGVASWEYVLTDSSSIRFNAMIPVWYQTTTQVPAWYSGGPYGTYITVTHTFDYPNDIDVDEFALWTNYDLVNDATGISQDYNFGNGRTYPLA